MVKENKTVQVSLKTLKDLLKEDLNNSRLAITTIKESAKVRMYDGSLESELVPTSPARIYIDSPNAPGIHIELVNLQDQTAPAGAIYKISAYKSAEHKHIETLNGDVYDIYVGKNGLMLSDAGLVRASELLKKRN